MLHIMSTTPTINIVPGRIAGHSNVITNGYRYTNDRKRGNKTYMKCVLYSNGCRAPITFMDGELITPVPDHTTHDVQHSETYVHVSKQSPKRDCLETCTALSPFLLEPEWRNRPPSAAEFQHSGGLAPRFQFNDVLQQPQHMEVPALLEKMSRKSLMLKWQSWWCVNHQSRDQWSGGYMVRSFKW